MSTLAVVALLYWRVLRYPFIQDDWQVLHSIVSGGDSAFIRQSFLPDYVLYRPIGCMYFLLMYKLFGMNPLGFHIFALVIHTLNSLLVIYLSSKIINHRFLAWATGIIYAAAMRVHLEPLAWMVGFYDLGAMFSLLLSFSLFIRGNKLASALVFVLGIYIKEQVVILPVVLLLYSHLIEPKAKFSFRRIYSSLWPHCAALLFYLVVKIAILHGVHLNEHDPYRISFFGHHVLDNLRTLASYGLEVLYSFSPGGLTSQFTLISVVLTVILSIWAIVKLGIKFSAQARLLIVWAVLGALPPALLVNHAMMGYYLTCSLPAIILLAVLGIKYIVDGLKLGNVAAMIVILMMILASVTSAAYSFQQQDKAGIWAAPIDDYLVPRAYFADMVGDYVKSRSTGFEKNTIFVIGGTNGLMYYPTEFQFRVLLKDDTVRSYVVPIVKQDASGAYIEVAGMDHFDRVDLPRDKTVYLYMNDEQLVESPVP